MPKLFLAFAWVFLSIGVILTGTAYFYSLKLIPEFSLNFGGRGAETELAIATHAENSWFDLDGEVQGVTSIVEIGDSRPTIVARFLERYDSPLKPHDYYGQKLVEIADRYNLDFRLLPAIMMQESNLCKNIPEGTHNCLGFGIHSRGTLGFDSYEAGFERAAREIKANYVDIGLTTPTEIQTKYTPSSQGSWANSVNQWMAEMRFDDRQLGRTQKTNADVLEFTRPEDDEDETEEEPTQSDFF